MNSYNFLKKFSQLSFFITITVLLASCGGGGSAGNANPSTAPVTAALAALGFDIKTFRFTWTDVSDATFYRLMENPDGVSGFSQVGADIAQGTQTFDHSVPLYQRTNASYILQSCNSVGCTDAATISISTTLAPAVGYFKASNTGTSDRYGISVTLSADGSTLAIGARDEDSDANGIDGNEADETASDAGAVYVYVKNSNFWVKQAYIKADNSTAGDVFGSSVSLSSSGDVLAVGATLKSTVYLFTRSGINWLQKGTVTAQFGNATDFFGDAVSISDDGSTLAVGARSEGSESKGLGSNGANGSLNGAPDAGAAYIFIEDAGNWTQQEYFKADNAEGDDFFGSSVSLSSDGNTFVVGATGEKSLTNGIAMTSAASNNMGSNVGAAYVFTRAGTNWTQEAYIKANSPDNSDNFGGAVSLSDDGNTLAVGAQGEDSMVNMIGGDDADDNAPQAGAAFVFSRSGTTWSQQAYVKPSNTDAGDNFGSSISISASGDTLVVGAENEQSNATGVNGDETNNSIPIINNGAGAAYVFTRNITAWSQQAYVKSVNTAENNFYGAAITISGDGSTLAVGAQTEDSDSTGIGGDTTNVGSPNSGAVYLY